MGDIVFYIDNINKFLNSLIWGPFTVGILIVIGIYISIRINFLQVRKLGLIIKSTIKSMFVKNRSKRGISSFEAVSTALAGTVGTGNIVGVATAIVSGGAGAIFWMWVSAFLGMGVKYSEIVLAIKYREKNKNGEYVGGPMYYLMNGLGSKFLAIVFSIFCILASFGIGNMTQSNSISHALKSAFNIPEVVSGVLVMMLVGLVILGGIKRIGKITSKIIPIMSFFYIIGTISVIIVNYKNILPAFKSIIYYAFNTPAVVGGVAGYGIRQSIKFGFSRGVFSNEAGLGSAPIAHASAEVDSEVKQGFLSIFEVFFDTIVMCTLTALVILTSGVVDSGLIGIELTSKALGSVMGEFSTYFVSIAIVFFAISSILGWYYYGEKSIEFLFKNQNSCNYYKILFLLLIFIGANLKLQLVWDISDTLNGFMVLPNLIGVVMLSNVVIKETKKFFNKRTK